MFLPPAASILKIAGQKLQDRSLQRWISAIRQAGAWGTQLGMYRLIKPACRARVSEVRENAHHFLQEQSTV